MSAGARAISFLEDMLEHAKYVSRFVAGVDRESFEADIEKQFAVVRALEVIGEAAKAIPIDIRNLSPNIPWRQISAMRDKLIHHYFGVDVEIVLGERQPGCTDLDWRTDHAPRHITRRSMTSLALWRAGRKFPG